MVAFLGLIVGLSAVSSVVGAVQTLSIPSFWTNTTSSLSRDSRQSLANDAATALLQQIDPSTGAATGLPRVQDVTSIYAVLALQDYYSGNSTWSNTVVNGMQVNIQRSSFYGAFPTINSDAIYWEITFFYAYRTYKQQVLLDLAVAAYNATYSSGFITPQAAATGTGAGRNVSFLPPPSCTTDTLAGGVFITKDVQNLTDINMESIGPFMALAAYLYELTRNPTYQQAVQLSLDFTLNHMFNASAGILVDTFHLSSCQLDMKPLTINQAWFIEGLSVWANVTNNSTLTTFLEAFVPNVTTFSSWSLQSGVISEASALDDGDSVLKGIFIRGLVEARARNPGTDLAKYIEAYITTQFNSILSLARSPAPNNSFYSTSWFGPPVSSFSAAGNIVTLDVLNAAFSFVSPSTSANNTSPGNSSTTAPSGSATHTADATKQASNTGAIAGGVAGGVVALLALASTAFLWRRHLRNRSRKYPLGSDRPGDSGDMRTTAVFEPFIVPPTTTLTGRQPPSSSKWQRYHASQREGYPSPSVTSPSSSAAASNGNRAGEPGPSESNVGPPQSDPAHNAGDSIDAIDVAEIPTLVGLLNNLLRDRQTQPPRYED